MLIFALSLQWNCNMEQSTSGQKSKDGHKNPVQVSIPAARVCANLLTTLKSHPVWEPSLLSIPAKQHPWISLTRRPGLQTEMDLSTETSTLDGPPQRLLCLHFWQRSYCLFNFTFLQLKTSFWTHRKMEGKVQWACWVYFSIPLNLYKEERRITSTQPKPKWKRAKPSSWCYKTGYEHNADSCNSGFLVNCSWQAGHLIP